MGGLRFGVDGDGNGGYYGTDGSLIPFKKGATIKQISGTLTSNTATINCDIGDIIIVSTFVGVNSMTNVDEQTYKFIQK